MPKGGQVVHDHHVAGVQRGREQLLDGREEPCPGHGLVEHHGCGHACEPERTDEVVVSQYPCGTLMRSRSPRGARPWRRAILAPDSPMNPSRSGSRSGWPGRLYEPAGPLARSFFERDRQTCQAANVTLGDQGTLHSGVVIDDDDTGIAFNATAGLSIQALERTHIDPAYRYEIVPDLEFKARDGTKSNTEPRAACSHLECGASSDSRADTIATSGSFYFTHFIWSAFTLFAITAAGVEGVARFLRSEGRERLGDGNPQRGDGSPSRAGLENVGSQRLSLRHPVTPWVSISPGRREPPRNRRVFRTACGSRARSSRAAQVGFRGGGAAGLRRSAARWSFGRNRDFAEKQPQIQVCARTRGPHGCNCSKACGIFRIARSTFLFRPDNRRCSGPEQALSTATTGPLFAPNRAAARRQ